MRDILNIGDHISSYYDNESVFNYTFTLEDIHGSWKSVGEIADLVANYYKEKYNDSIDHNIISMVLNELIENAAKFSYENTSKIAIQTFKKDKKIYVKISNVVSKKRWEQLLKICNELFSNDLHTLFIDRLYKLKNNKKAPGIGLIILKKDYNANLNFSFQKYNTNELIVSVTAEIPCVTKN